MPQNPLDGRQDSQLSIVNDVRPSDRLRVLRLSEPAPENQNVTLAVQRLVAFVVAQLGTITATGLTPEIIAGLFGAVAPGADNPFVTDNDLTAGLAATLQAALTGPDANLPNFDRLGYEGSGVYAFDFAFTYQLPGDTTESIFKTKDALAAADFPGGLLPYPTGVVSGPNADPYYRKTNGFEVLAMQPLPLADAQSLALGGGLVPPRRYNVFGMDEPAGTLAAPLYFVSVYASTNEAFETQGYAVDNNGIPHYGTVDVAAGTFTVGGDYVDRTTDQDVDGQKTFLKPVQVDDLGGSLTRIEAGNVQTAGFFGDPVTNLSAYQLTLAGQALTGGPNGISASGSIFIATAPTVPAHAANKQYVDGTVGAAVAGLSYKDEVRLRLLSIPGGGTLATAGLPTVQGVTIAAGDRLMLSLGTSESGIYVASAGTWVRADDANTTAKMRRATAFVTEGTYATDGSGNPIAYTATFGTGSLGSTAFSFTPNPSLIYSASTGLMLTGGAFAADFASTAEEQAGASSTKVSSPAGRSSWWTAIKAAVQTIVGVWNFSNGLKLAGGSTITGSFIRSDVSAAKKAAVRTAVLASSYGWVVESATAVGGDALTSGDYLDRYFTDTVTSTGATAPQFYICVQEVDGSGNPRIIWITYKISK